LFFGTADPWRLSAYTVQPWEALIRTLSVSLVAVAAIAASLLLARSREGDEEARLRLTQAGDGQPARLQLDAIRAAGL
jgi:hypothetical protein